MKSDRGGRSGAVLLVLTGLGTLLVGCASLSPLPEDDRGSERPASPDPPLEIVGAPDRAVATPDIEHLPDAPHRDLPWRTAAPVVPVVREPAPPAAATPAAATPEAATPAAATPEAILEPPAAPVPVAGPASLRPEAGGVSEAHVSGLTSVPVPSPPAAFREKPEVVLHPPPALSTALSTALSPVASLDDVVLPERRGVAAGETLPPPDIALPEHRDAANADDVSVGSNDTAPSQDSASDDRIASPEPAAASSSAPVTQPSVPATTAGRAPREDTSGERRVDPGQPFEVALPGRGWVYLGGGDELQFLDRTTQEGDVVFSFRGPAVNAAPREPTTLEFESQDLATGRRTRHEERVLVAEGGDSGSGRDAGPADANAVGEDAAGAGEGTGAEEPAGAGGVPADLSQADYAGLLVRVDDLEAAGEHREAVDLLEAMRRAGMGHDDELIMRLAQLYESEWSGRDLPQARELYHRVVENYPFSRWRRRARERIEYLNRHFFHIR